jgi:glycerophosphoryl diester phosphodiesterase
MNEPARPSTGHVPLIIAHRGKAGDAPENSAAAIRAAVAAGADIVELDVRLTLDRRPVVIHDPFLGRTADRRGPIALMPSPALRWIHIGDERIPLLREILRTFPPGAMPGLHVKALGALGPTLRDLRRYGNPGRTWLWLESPAAVAQAQRAFPGIRCVLLRPGGWRPDARARYFRDARHCGASAVSVATHGIDTDLIAQAHDAGLAVFSRIDDPHQVVQLGAMGIDGGITDDTTDVRRLRDSVAP